DACIQNFTAVGSSRRTNSCRNKKRPSHPAGKCFCKEDSSSRKDHRHRATLPKSERTEEGPCQREKNSSRLQWVLGAPSTPNVPKLSQKSAQRTAAFLSTDSARRVSFFSAR